MKIVSIKTVLVTALVTATFSLPTSLTSAQTVAPPQTGAGAQQRTERNERFRGKGMRGKHRGKRGMFKLKRLAAQLNITDAQRTAMREIGERYKTTTQAQREQLRALRPQAGAISDAAQIARQAEIRANLFTAKQNMRNETLAVLTPEQRTQLQTLKEQGKARRQEFRQRMKERRAEGIQQPNG